MRLILPLLLLVALPCFALAAPPENFRVKLLTVDANEGCDIADIDGDGKLDVIAGRNWYRNGDWVPRPVRLIEDANGYVHSNGDFARDVNGDGHIDVVAGTFFDGKIYWYENPGPEGLRYGHLWKRHLLIDTKLTTNEATILYDLDGDGVEEWITNQWNPAHPLLVCRFGMSAEEGDEPSRPILNSFLIGERNGHGIGVGDINNDGRIDILVGHGWYEGPEEGPFEGKWIFHEDWKRQFPCPMLVTDVDGDGINDLIASEAHGFGLFVWFGEGTDSDGKLKFREQMIDNTFSQAHALHLADLDGDGVDELITGKRFRAHNGSDPGADEPLGLSYYKWNADEKKFDKYIINRGQVGIGLQIRTADIDGDGDIDIVVAGKDGTQILFNPLND